MLNFRMRKLMARIALPFVFVFLVASPAYALIGLVPLVIRMGGSAGLGTGVEVSALVHLAAIGMSLPYIEVSNPSNPISVRLPTTEAQPVPSPTAQATTAPTASSGQYTVTGSTFGFSGSGTDPVPLCVAAWDAWRASRGFAPLATTVIGTSGQCTYTGGTTIGALIAYTPPVQTCGSGYVLNGSVCELSNARQAQPDNACDVSRSGSALQMLQDADCPPLTTGDMINACVAAGIECQISNADPFGNSYIFNRSSSSGQPEVVAVTPTSDGGTKVSVSTQRQSGSTSVIDTTSINVNGAGTVTGVSGSTQTGNITANTDGTLAVNGTGNTVTPTDVSFPSDYAVRGEAQDAIDSVAPTLQGIADSLSDSGTVSDPVEPSATDMPGWGNTFSGLTGWQLPAHGSACPTPSVDLSAVLGAGSVYTFDGHCALISDHFQALQAVMMLVWTMLSVMIVLRA